MKARAGRRVLSRQDRYKTRISLGPLRNLMMTDNMRRRYETALKRYFAFDNSISSLTTMDYADVDASVAEFIEQLWQEGDPRYWAEDTLSGFAKLIPDMRGHLRLSWALVTAWQRNEPPQRCAPLSLDVLLAMVGRAALLGWNRMALLLLIGFHCMLRAAEMYKLRVGDFEIDRRLTHGVITLQESKSGTRFNMVESVTIDDAALIRLFKAITLHLNPGDLIFPEGANRFRQQFDTLVADLSLPSTLLYKPYSIRRGAATADFLGHGKLSRTCVRGRWANEKTCRIYINEATTSLTAIRFSSSTAVKVRRWKERALSLLS